MKLSQVVKKSKCLIIAAALLGGVMTTGSALAWGPWGPGPGWGPRWGGYGYYHYRVYRWHRYNYHYHYYYHYHYWHRNVR